MEGCSKTSAGAVPGLPDDPLVEILSRVPAVRLPVQVRVQGLARPHRRP